LVKNALFNVSFLDFKISSNISHLWKSKQKQIGIINLINHLKKINLFQDNTK